MEEILKMVTSADNQPHPWIGAPEKLQLDIERALWRQKVDMVRNAWRVQEYAGNGDQDAYMLGYYNGLELAMSYLEDRPANFRSSEDAKSAP